MPSAKAHDAVTVLLAIPTFIVAWVISRDLTAALVIAIASLFGGLIFGPDLDTFSKHYTRWGVFRVIWFPYRTFFKHRSRFTHGIFFGTLLRTVYLMGVITLIAFFLTCASAIYQHSALPSFLTFSEEWRELGEFVSLYAGPNFAWLVFFGLWWGGVSHSLTDMAGTYVKTGKVKAML